MPWINSIMTHMIVLNPSHNFPLMSVTNPGRIAIVGTGSRGLMFISGISERPNSVVVALCEPNAVRAEYYNQILEEQGRPRVPIFKPEEFKDMLVIAEVDTVVIASIDSTHHIYIIAAWEAGGGSYGVDSIL